MKAAQFPERGKRQFLTLDKLERAEITEVVG